MKSKEDPLAVCSQTSLRNGGNFKRRKAYLQGGHSCPETLARCQWNALSVLDLGFKNTTGNLVLPLRCWSPPVKIPAIFSSCKCQVHPWQWERERLGHEEDDLSLGLWAQEENLKTEGAWTVMNCVRKEDWGNKGRNIRWAEIGEDWWWSFREQQEDCVLRTHLPPDPGKLPQFPQSLYFSEVRKQSWHFGKSSSPPIGFCL